MRTPACDPKKARCSWPSTNWDTWRLDMQPAGRRKRRQYEFHATEDTWCCCLFFQGSISLWLAPGSELRVEITVFVVCQFRVQGSSRTLSFLGDISLVHTPVDGGLDLVLWRVNSPYVAYYIFYVLYGEFMWICTISEVCIPVMVVGSWFGISRLCSDGYYIRMIFFAHRWTDVSILYFWG